MTASDKLVAPSAGYRAPRRARKVRPFDPKHRAIGDAIGAQPPAEMIDAINALAGHDRAEVIRWLVRLDHLTEAAVGRLCVHSTKPNRDPSTCSLCLNLTPDVRRTLTTLPDTAVLDETIAPVVAPAEPKPKRARMPRISIKPPEIPNEDLS